MIAAKGIFDGKQVRLLEEVKIEKPTKVIVTFLNESDEEEDIPVEEIRRLAEQGKAFDFLNDTEEDIYTDDDLKVRYWNY